MKTNTTEQRSSRPDSGKPQPPANTNGQGNDEQVDKEDFEVFFEEIQESCSKYLKARPLVATGMVFALGFYLGWKIKPW